MATTAAHRPGRNEPCTCGSGRKYKFCCLAKDEAADRAAHEVVAADTHQPWKASSAPGFVPKMRPPRKMGGG